MSGGTGGQSHRNTGNSSTPAGRYRRSSSNPPVGYAPTSPFMNGQIVNTGGMINGPQFMDAGRNAYFTPVAAASTSTPGMRTQGLDVPTPIFASLPPPMIVNNITGGQQVGPLPNGASGEIIYPEELNVFVKNLDDSFDVVKLATVFGACGNILSAKVETLENGVSKGFGFVCYRTAEEANQAIREFNGKIVGTKPLYVAHYQPKAKRQAWLRAKREEILSRQISDNQVGNDRGNSTNLPE